MYFFMSVTERRRRRRVIQEVLEPDPNEKTDRRRRRRWDVQNSITYKSACSMCKTHTRYDARRKCKVVDKGQGIAARKMKVIKNDVSVNT